MVQQLVGIVRLLSTGLIDTSFNVGLGADTAVETIEIQIDSKKFCRR
jgi:hypothetical protein